MRVLLDTQAWLWMQASSSRLNERALALVRDPSADLHLSAVSSWEIAIKYALGKLPLPATPTEYVPERMRSSRVHPLEVTHSYALQVTHLPGHHHDPFDRLLIAQAQLDGLTVLTSDKVFEQYDVPVFWAA